MHRGVRQAEASGDHVEARVSLFGVYWFAQPLASRRYSHFSVVEPYTFPGSEQRRDLEDGEDDTSTLLGFSAIRRHSKTLSHHHHGAVHPSGPSVSSIVF